MSTPKYANFEEFMNASKKENPEAWATEEPEKPVQPSEAEEKKAKKRKMLEILRKKQKSLARMNEKYSLCVVNGNYELTSKWFNAKTYNRKTNFKPAELSFIRKVKKHVVDNAIWEKFTKFIYTEDISYFEFTSDKTPRVLKNIVEIDINHAYWQAALKLGVISPEIYRTATSIDTKISKQARLAALGSLARTKHHYDFQGTKLIAKREEKQLQTKNIWYHICKMVADVMQEIKQELGKHFLFYWVDGVYFDFSKARVNRVEKILKKYGFDYSLVCIYEVKVDTQTFEVRDLPHLKERPFNYPKNKKRIPKDELFNLRDIYKKVMSGTYSKYLES